jgi:hypothetical protein
MAVQAAGFHLDPLLAEGEFIHAKFHFKPESPSLG